MTDKKPDPIFDSGGRIPIKSNCISAYILRFHKDRCHILLLLRNGVYLKNVWQPVTGKVENGETAWQAALREIKEETGIIPDRLYSADFVESFYEQSQNSIHLAPVFVGVVDDDRQVILSGEHKEYHWAAPDEACQMVAFDQQMNAIRHIEKYFIINEPKEFFKIAF